MSTRHQRHRDQAYTMLAFIAESRPQLEAGLKHNDIPHGRYLQWTDVPGMVAVLREASTAGSTAADSLLQYRLTTLQRQRARRREHRRRFAPGSP